jgi:hypothetical protein
MTVMDVFSGMTGVLLVSRSCSSRFTDLETGIFAKAEWPGISRTFRQLNCL